jgi:hypothetical protein
MPVLWIRIQSDPKIYGSVLQAVLWIRIRMFLGLLDPDPERLVRGTDTDGSGSFNHQAKIGRKTLIPTVLRLIYEI